MNEFDSIPCSDAEELLFEQRSDFRLRAHLATCARCRSLAERLQSAAGPAFDLAEAVLRQTGSSACDRACVLLFGEPTTEERELLDGHLRHCQACQRLAAADRWAVGRLPRLATLDPGEEFTRAVLRKTSGRRRVRTSRLHRYLQRRQAPLEMAYAVAVLVVLLIAPPGAPLKGLPSTLQTWLAGDEKSGPRGAGWVEAAVLPAAGLPAQAVEQGAQWTQALGGGISLRAGQFSWAVGAFGGHAKQLGTVVTEREWEELRPVLGEMRCDMRLMLRGARGRMKSPDERC